MIISQIASKILNSPQLVAFSLLLQKPQSECFGYLYYLSSYCFSNKTNILNQEIVKRILEIEINEKFMTALEISGVTKNAEFKLFKISINKQLKLEEVIDIHPILKGLELYETDAVFCKKFPKLLKEWRKAYPSVNIEEEILKAHIWEVSNHQKTNRARFISNWLARSQDKRGGYSNGSYSATRHGFGVTAPVGKYANIQEPREKLGSDSPNVVREV